MELGSKTRSIKYCMSRSPIRGRNTRVSQNLMVHARLGQLSYIQGQARGKEPRNPAYRMREARGRYRGPRLKAGRI